MGFYQHFEQLCLERGESMDGIVKELGFSGGVVTKWKNGSIPRNSTLKKIADHFGVTVDWLLSDEAVTPSKWDSKKETSEYGTLSSSEKMILDMWRELDAEGQRKLMLAVLHRHDIERCRMNGVPNPYADESPVGSW